MIELPIIVPLTLDTSKTTFAFCLETHDEVYTMTNSMAIQAVITEPYEGDYIVIPQADSQTVLQTAGKYLHDNVTVTRIPTYETHNEFGTTFYIAEV